MHNLITHNFERALDFEDGDHFAYNAFGWFMENHMPAPSKRLHIQILLIKRIHDGLVPTTNLPADRGCVYESRQNDFDLYTIVVACAKPQEHIAQLLLHELTHIAQYIKGETIVKEGETYLTSKCEREARENEYKLMVEFMEFWRQGYEKGSE